MKKPGEEDVPPDLSKMARDLGLETFAAEVEAEVQPQADVQMIYDGDSGVAGERHG